MSIRVELSQQEIGDYESMTSIDDFNLSILQDTLSPLPKDPFAASHPQMQSVPQATFFIFDLNTPPSEWSPSPLEESQPLPTHLSNVDETPPDDNEDTNNAPQVSPGSSSAQSVEVHDSPSPSPSGIPSQHTPPHSAPLLDSRVYLFFTHSASDDLDFACMGHGRKPRCESSSTESRSFSSGRSRAWTSPGRAQSSMYHTKSPHAPTRIISGPMGRERKLLARELIKNDVPFSGRRPLFHDKAESLTMRRRAGMRISNKWGEHPPEGYF